MRLRLPIFIILALALASFAAAEDKDKLTTTVLRVHPEIFWPHLAQTELPSPSESIKEEKSAPKPIPLPRTIDGERRYDVMGWFEFNGMQRQPGMFAIYLDRTNYIVIRASAEDVEFAERVMECPCIEFAIKQIRATTNLWTFEADGLLDPAKYPHTLAELRTLAGPSLKLLDAHTLVTKSGNRTVGENLSAPPRKPAPPAPAPQSSDKTANPKAPEAAPEETEPGIFSGSRGSVLKWSPTSGRTARVWISRSLIRPDSSNLMANLISS